MKVNITEDAKNAIVEYLKKKKKENSYMRIVIKSFG